MKTTTPILSELQSKTFGENAIQFIDGRDLNYEGNNASAPEHLRKDFVLSGTDAIKNKVMFWLSSAEGDYIREPDKGGVLWGLLGKSMTASNATRIEKDIVAFFNSSFQGELSLLRVNVTKDVENRRWKIQLFVQDPIRREVFNTIVGVSI